MGEVFVPYYHVSCEKSRKLSEKYPLQVMRKSQLYQMSALDRGKIAGVGLHNKSNQNLTTYNLSVKLDYTCPLLDCAQIITFFGARKNWMAR